MATRFRTSGIEMGTSIMDVSGSAPSFPARAWVSMSTTNPSGGVGTNGNNPIRGSGNVTAVVDQGVGVETVYMTNSLPDANYAIQGTSNQPGINFLYLVMDRFPYRDVRTNTTFSVIVGVVVGSGGITASDVEYLDLVVFR